jgi:anaerobic magnesium-protoporphyrin IX monomethyl ester cyclase
MTKILLINPNKWGRGITHIWIPTHSSILKKKNHEVELFDCTFYSDWTDNEIEYSTSTGMFKQSDYGSFIKYKSSSVIKDLQDKIDSFKPDLIFWSALSSHIHSEGEYVNIENGYDLLKKINVNKAIKITGGLQATATPELVFKNFPNIDYLIMGESEMVLAEIADSLNNNKSPTEINGVSFIKDNQVIKNNKQKIINDLDILTPYDYSIFDDQVFFRGYNGEVVRAVDFELSRGCIYSCTYCVETIIQNYYGFNESSKKTGAINNFKSYLRHKSAKNIFKEIKDLNTEKKINFIRCQDTNFLTNDKKVLTELSELIESSNLEIRLYIETRPEGINDKSVALLKKLKVDGVGMGVELSAEDFRETELNRFASQSKTIQAFDLLKKNNIKRTSYNVIGFPNQTEESILQTIEFNKLLNPDNMTIAFYSPYYGTAQHTEGVKKGVFDEFESGADATLRSVSRSLKLSKEKLEYYKMNFVSLVRDGK